MRLGIAGWCTCAFSCGFTREREGAWIWRLGCGLWGQSLPRYKLLRNNNLPSIYSSSHVQWCCCVCHVSSIPCSSMQCNCSSLLLAPLLDAIRFMSCNCSCQRVGSRSLVRNVVLKLYFTVMPSHINLSWKAWPHCWTFTFTTTPLPGDRH